MTLRTNEEKASEDAANLLLRIGVATAFVAAPVFQLLSQRAIFILPPIGGALILSAANLLREREAQQIVTQIYSRSQAQTGLVKALGGTRRRIVTILPSIDIR